MFEVLTVSLFSSVGSVEKETMMKNSLLVGLAVVKDRFTADCSDSPDKVIAPGFELVGGVSVLVFSAGSVLMVRILL